MQPIRAVGDELETFKQHINLVELASYYGYELIRKESSRSSVVMSHPDGDKVVIATASDGHGIFFSVRDTCKGGSVVDFVMSREGCSLGAARIVLRKCLVPDWLAPQSSIHYRPIATESNTTGLYANWLAFKPYAPGGYLETRGLKPDTIAAFSDRIRLDPRGNVAFRHDDLHSFTGWEMKNRGFTGFSGGGKKALFACKVGVGHKEAPPIIAITESAIDALSYYQVTKTPGLYLSFAGGLSTGQMDLLKQVINLYPDARVLAATDNDDQGDRYASVISCMRDGVKRDRPVRKDWNDLLCRR